MNNNANPVLLGVAAVMAVIFAAFLFLFFTYFRLWLQALLTGTPVSIAEIIGMRLRRTPPQLIVHATIALRQRGVQATAKGVESCYLAFAIGQQLTADQLADLYVQKVGELEKRP